MLAALGVHGLSQRLWGAHWFLAWGPPPTVPADTKPNTFPVHFTSLPPIYTTDLGIVLALPFPWSYGLSLPCVLRTRIFLHKLPTQPLLLNAVLLWMVAAVHYLPSHLQGSRVFTQRSNWIQIGPRPTPALTFQWFPWRPQGEVQMRSWWPDPPQLASRPCFSTCPLFLSSNFMPQFYYMASPTVYASLPFLVGSAPASQILSSFLVNWLIPLCPLKLSPVFLALKSHSWQSQTVLEASPSRPKPLWVSFSATALKSCVSQTKNQNCGWQQALLFLLSVAAIGMFGTQHTFNKMFVEVSWAILPRLGVLISIKMDFKKQVPRKEIERKHRPWEATNGIITSK